MSKRAKKPQTSVNKFPGYEFVAERDGISEWKLKKNGLTVLYKEFKGTGVITTNITYQVGSRDEAVGETGIAHMLEHMLFKPTRADLRRRTDSGAMKFERDTGCILNANTWKDRTTYFFSYPTTYFEHALSIEAERMNDVVLTDKEFQPERSNVLSEFDMYFGDPKFALSVSLVGTAFHSHPYGHETIGFREDIERYTVEKLERFYQQFYRPDNATMMVIGDVTRSSALSAVAKAFGHIQNPALPIPRHSIIEPKQEGLRRANIVRESNTNLLAIGIKHAGYPEDDWFRTAVLFDVLAGRADSVLHKLLVDTGLASSVEYMIEPASEQNLGIIYVSLAKGVKHADVEEKVLSSVRKLRNKDIENDTKKAVQSMLTNELFARDSSLSLAMGLTEDVAAGDWKTFTEVEKKLTSITPSNIVALIQDLFTERNLTIGYFIGTK